jgi:Fe-Mn family superoxide dismutase
MIDLTRRQALLALAATPLAALAADEAPKGYTLPRLPYDPDALEPHIDTETMKIHHGRHHLAYITTANNTLKPHPKLLALPVEKLLADISSVPEGIRQTVINSAGGHSNHSIFWETMGPKGGGEPKGALGKQIDKSFGSFDKFQKAYSQAAMTVFGSGWAWLVQGDKGLAIVQRKNQDSPYMDGLKPLLGLDVWEHAYYLKYQNKRVDYVAAWWNVVNWKAVADRASAK